MSMTFNACTGLSEQKIISQGILDNPYLPEAYLSRAEWYRANGFPDLASGDAYKALLLADDIEEM